MILSNTNLYKCPNLTSVNMETTQTEMKQLITRGMTIGDVVQRYPACIETLQEAGVHCVGCHVSYHETLEQGFAGHGMPDEQIDEVITKMNRAVLEGRHEEGKDFIITKKAADKLVEVLKENSKESAGLRIEVVPGGCSGFQYGLEVEETSTDLDIVVEDKGVRIIIGKDNLQFLKGAKLDYVDSIQGAGFKITNPNVKSSCGCGQSFEQ
jgi:iron-sulfur cluster assembly protein